MARERMVTRTIESTTYEVMLVDRDTKVTTTAYLSLTGEQPKDEEKIIKSLNKLLVNTNDRVVCVLSQETTVKLYGMKEVDFIQNATELPDREVK